MSRNTYLARACAPLIATTGVLAVTAAPAAAHVTISPEEAAAGSYTVLTASVGHGCDGSPTTRIAIQMPEQVLSVTPTRHPQWDVRKVMEKLDEPVADSHGNEVTERVGQVVYTAKQPLPDGYRDAFELSLQLPETPGETLVFPVVQTCQQGETAWVQTAEDGDTEELDEPAPTVTVLEAAASDAHGAAADEAADEGSDEGADEGADEASEDATENTAAMTSEDGGVDGWSIAALVASLVAVVLAAAALAVARRRP